jgi:hypothetical protein
LALWWDGTLASGRLRRPGDDAGGWFNFSLSGRMRAGEPVVAGKTLSNKDAVDCPTGKLKVIVI